MRILIFSGTSEGHALCRFLSARGARAEAYVATEYGEAVMEPLPGITLHTGRLSADELRQAIGEGALVIDATHPYAAEVTRNLRQACQKSEYIRLLRPSTASAEGCITVPDTAAAAAWLDACEDTALLTTGSKELAVFTNVHGYRGRLYPRVLPSTEAIEKCLSLGFPAAHILAMQGPFSEELNTALLRQTGASVLVTKDTGAAGGFSEKLAAARAAGAQVLLIARPTDESGYTLAETERLLTARLGLREPEDGMELEQPKTVSKSPKISPNDQELSEIVRKSLEAVDALTENALPQAETASKLPENVTELPETVPESGEIGRKLSEIVRNSLEAIETSSGNIPPQAETTRELPKNVAELSETEPEPDGIDRELSEIVRKSLEASELPAEHTARSAGTVQKRPEISTEAPNAFAKPVIKLSEPGKKSAEMNENIPRFPLFVSLEGCIALVVGAGKIAARRVAVLRRFGAQVRVIASENRAGVDGVLLRPFAPGDLEGVTLAVAATDDRAVNRQVAELCRAQGIPVSVADCAAESTFFFPAVCEGGGLTAGLVSAGKEHTKVRETAEKIRKLLCENL